MTHTYKHKFRGGVKATAMISMDPFSFRVEWQGRPTRKVFPEYCRWRQTIFDDIHKRTGKRVAVIDLV
jgi:hypothetical protein